MALTNANGDLTDTYDYTAFGTVWDRRATNTQPYQYLGNAYDSGTKLHDFHARAYNSSVGWFSSKDPVAGLATVPQTLNPYSFGVNDRLT